MCARRPCSHPSRARAGRLAPHFPRGLLPEAWRTLLEQLSSGASASSSPLAQSELVAAAQESLRSGAAPLELRSGLVDKCYTMRRELASGSGFKVMEGVERRGGSDSAAKPEAQRNFSIKIISLPSRKLSRQKADKASKPLDPMQAFYLICSFVDEVFSHPNFIAVVMKWGMHEVDASHQLSSWIAESLSLLRELLPAERRSRCYLRFSARELQRVLLRSSCLDLYLQTHLFIQ